MPALCPKHKNYYAHYAWHNKYYASRKPYGTRSEYKKNKYMSQPNLPFTLQEKPKTCHLTQNTSRCQKHVYKMQKQSKKTQIFMLTHSGIMPKSRALCPAGIMPGIIKSSPV